MRTLGGRDRSMVELVAGSRPSTRVLGPLLALVWVVYLLQPWQAAWQAPHGAVRTLALVAVAVQAALFSVLALAGGPARRRGLLRRWGWAMVAGQAVCVALAAPAAGSDALVGLIFVSVSAVIALPRRWALVAVVAALAGTMLVPRLVPGWRTLDDLTLSIALASAAVFAFVQLVAANRELTTARDEVAVLAVDRERERIARDMHDILGHSLTVVAVKAELAGRLVEIDPGRARDEIGQVQALARSALADVRAMVSATRDVTLAGELAGARHALDTAGIEAEVPMVVDQVPETLRPLFAWAVREGVTNVLRHAAAQHVRITMTAGSLVVEDDGRGQVGSAGGHGLTGLSERARAVGARVESGGAPGGGYRLAVRAGGAA
jgi:two-component system sensor histidine kinase DesK